MYRKEIIILRKIVHQFGFIYKRKNLLACTAGILEMYNLWTSNDVSDACDAMPRNPFDA